MASRTRANPRRHLSIQFRFIVFASMLALITLVPLIIWTNWNLLLTWIFAWTPVTFLFYGFDKLQAVGRRLRVPETSLLAMAALGGFLGAIGGMLLFRHKTAKPKFWIVNLSSLLVYTALFILVLR